MTPEQRRIIEAKLIQARALVKVFQERVAAEKARNKEPVTPTRKQK